MVGAKFFDQLNKSIQNRCDKKEEREELKYQIKLKEKTIEDKKKEVENQQSEVKTKQDELKELQ